MKKKIVFPIFIIMIFLIGFQFQYSVHSSGNLYFNEQILIPELDKDYWMPYVSGYPDDTIRPENNISRAEVAVMFYNLIKDENKADYEYRASDFNDVGRSQWYSQSIGCLLYFGILSGYSDGTFRPEDSISRAEFAAISSRFYALNLNGESSFNDIQGHWAYNNITSVFNDGWIFGYPDGTFKPDNKIIRAEAMAIINRILGRDKEEYKDCSALFLDLFEDKWYYTDVLAAYNANSFKLRIYTDPGNYPVDFGELEPIIDKNKRILVPVSCVEKVIHGAISCEIIGDVVTITHKGFEYDKVVKVETGSRNLYVDNVLVVMDTVPAYINGQIYIPIEPIAEALEHFVRRNIRFNELNITYDGIEIYVWNENKDSSVDGLRYAILQGTRREKELSEIYDRAVNDLNLIKDQFSKVPSGYYGRNFTILIMYKIKGYKVRYDEFEKITRVVQFHFGMSYGYGEWEIDDVESFIEGTGNYTDYWFSKQLMALDEKSIRENKTQTYRFSCFRSFHEPFSIRVEILPDGKGTLHFAMCDGPISAWGGDLIEKQKKDLNKEEADKLIKLLNENNYWNLSTSNNDYGFDGSIWMIEGIKDGKYHIVERWTPDEGAIYDLGQYFIELWGGQINQLY